MQNMSFSATTEQIRAQTKTETRRLKCRLKKGQLFCAIVKGRGLKKGQRIQRLAILQCLSNRPQRLNRITAIAVAREGFVNRKGLATKSPADFVRDFCRLNRCRPKQQVQVVRFRYISRCCRACGCWDLQACPGGCYWAEPDLCSACYFS